MKANHIYYIWHRRKGHFMGELIGEDKEFATFKITDGHAKDSEHTVWSIGEEVSVAKILCIFAECTEESEAES